MNGKMVRLSELSSRDRDESPVYEQANPDWIDSFLGELRRWKAYKDEEEIHRATGVSIGTVNDHFAKQPRHRATLLVPFEEMSLIQRRHPEATVSLHQLLADRLGHIVVLPGASLGGDLRQRFVRVMAEVGDVARLCVKDTATATLAGRQEMAREALEAIAALRAFVGSLDLDAQRAAAEVKR